MTYQMKASEEMAHLPVHQGSLQTKIPNSGTICFKDYSASYREDSDIVLKSLNLEIPQGTKIALVGRTGSGKSTIIQALFRMLFVRSGDITIADQSIYQYRPEETRSIFE